MWLNTLCGAVCQRLGLRFAAVYNEDEFERDLQRWAREQGVNFLAFGNTDSNWCRSLPPQRAFHVVRDRAGYRRLRLLLAPEVHSTSAWPELVAHREKLRQLGREDGLLVEIRFRQRSFNQLAAWDYDQPHFLEVRCGGLATRSHDLLLAIFGHLGLIGEADYRLAASGGSAIRGIRARRPSRLARDFLGPSASPHPAAPGLLTPAWRQRFQAMSRGRA